MIRAILVVLLLLSPRALAAETVGDLYESSTLVTGQGVANRIPAFGRCVVDVLVKVSGDLSLRDDPRAAPFAADAARLVRDFRYRDLLAGIPIHDEQGSRDRPHELTVTFDPAAVDAALQTLGRRPWGPERPRVAVVVAVEKGTTRFVLARDGTHGIDEREALAAAARLRGLPVVLPETALLAERGIAPTGIDAALRLDPARLGGERILAGSMTWDEKLPGWRGAWRLANPAGEVRWETLLPTFDATFRDALGGAAQVLAGYGAPTRGTP